MLNKIVCFFDGHKVEVIAECPVTKVKHVVCTRCGYDNKPMNPDDKSMSQRGPRYI
jgi:hypothetical protein